MRKTPALDADAAEMRKLRTRANITGWPPSPYSARTGTGGPRSITTGSVRRTQRRCWRICAPEYRSTDRAECSTSRAVPDRSRLRWPAMSTRWWPSIRKPRRSPSRSPRRATSASPAFAGSQAWPRRPRSTATSTLSRSAMLSIDSIATRSRVVARGTCAATGVFRCSGAIHRDAAISRGSALSTRPPNSGATTSYLNRTVLGAHADAFERDLRERLLSCRPDGVFTQVATYRCELARRAR
jgi:hypothetical protein